jgi:hypothetical protein
LQATRSHWVTEFRVIFHRSPYAGIIESTRQMGRLLLHFAFYKFCRIHSTIRVTPAMQAGIADHVWDLAELLA